MPNICQQQCNMPPKSQAAKVQLVYTDRALLVPGAAKDNCTKVPKHPPTAVCTFPKVTRGTCTAHLHRAGATGPRSCKLHQLDGVAPHSVAHASRIRGVKGRVVLVTYSIETFASANSDTKSEEQHDHLGWMRGSPHRLPPPLTKTPAAANILQLRQLAAHTAFPRPGACHRHHSVAMQLAAHLPAIS